MTVRALLAAIVALVVLTAGSGCSPNDPAASSPESRAPGPVLMPELSRAAMPVQEQLRHQYASLSAKIKDATTPVTVLADEYGAMGKLFMAAEYREAAAACFLNAQALVAADVRWPYYLGHVYRLDGDLVNAALSFERALALQPDEIATLIWLGEINLRQGRPELAEPRFTKALMLQPALASAQFGLGRVALTRKDHAGAVKYLEAALAGDQLASGIHYPLAMAYRGLGAADKAEIHLRQRGQIDPTPPDPLMSAVNESLHSAMGYERLGIKALDRKAWTEAAAYFRKGVELAPDSPTVRHRLGTALFLNGDSPAAMAQFEEVVRRSPDFAKARYSLGVLLISAGRETEALEQLSAAVRSDPNYVEARLRLAEVLRRSGRADAALSEYQHVIGIDPHAAEARFGLAIALVRLGRYQEARDRLTEGMQLYPDRPAFARALARLLAAAPDGRVRDGKQALALTRQLLGQRQTLDVGETMAMTLAELGQYDQAAAFQREVMAAAQKGGHHDVVQQLARNLELYERRQPCRTPLRTDDPVEAFEPLQQ